MKKLLVLMFAFGITIAGTLAAEQVKPTTANTKPANIQEIRKAREAAFEKRLGLTEEQKIKAREIRIKGHEKMKPIMEQIKAKKQEAEVIKRSRMAVQMQEEKLAVIDAELKELEKQAMEFRRANFKEFESILTKKQKNILKQMKKEGKKNHRATHSGARV